MANLTHIKEDLSEVLSELTRLNADVEPAMPRREDLLLLIAIFRDESHRFSTAVNSTPTNVEQSVLDQMEAEKSRLEKALDQLKKKVYDELDKDVDFIG